MKIILTRIKRKGKEFWWCRPYFLPERGWAFNSKGYVQSRSNKHGVRRNEFAHREVLRRLGATEEQLKSMHVHHQNFNSLCNCPYNLILVPPQFNKRSQIRHPYLGYFMSYEKYMAEFS